MKLRCETCFNLLARRPTSNEVSVRCRRCKVWQPVSMEGRDGETVRCAGVHPRPTDAAPKRVCNAILLVRTASRKFVIQCERCGHDRAFPEKRTILLDSQDEGAVALSA